MLFTDLRKLADHSRLVRFGIIYLPDRWNRTFRFVTSGSAFTEICDTLKHIGYSQGVIGQ